MSEPTEAATSRLSMWRIQNTTSTVVHIERKNAAKSRIFVHGVPKSAVNSRMLVHNEPKNAGDFGLKKRNSPCGLPPIPGGIDYGLQLQLWPCPE